MFQVTEEENPGGQPNPAAAPEPAGFKIGHLVVSLMGTLFYLFF